MRGWFPNSGAVGDDWKPVAPASSRVVKRIVCAEGRRSGREEAVALECMKHLDEWSECLLIVQLWGVWPSDSYSIADPAAVPNAKSCSDGCTVGCVRTVCAYDRWRPQSG